MGRKVRGGSGRWARVARRALGAASMVGLLASGEALAQTTARPGGADPSARSSTGTGPVEPGDREPREPSAYEQRRGLNWGGGVGTEFWLPLDAVAQSGRPPSLIGGHLRGFGSWKRSRTSELRFGLAASMVASSRGSLMPLGAFIEPIFSPVPVAFASLSLGAGMMVSPVPYKPDPDEYGLTPSPFVAFHLTPFGFRFGPGDRGEFGLRFGGLISKIENSEGRQWTLSFMNTAVWLSYLLPR